MRLGEAIGLKQLEGDREANATGWQPETAANNAYSGDFRFASAMLPDPVRLTYSFRTWIQCSRQRRPRGQNRDISPSVPNQPTRDPPV